MASNIQGISNGGLPINSLVINFAEGIQDTSEDRLASIFERVYNNKAFANMTQDLESNHNATAIIAFYEKFLPYAAEQLLKKDDAKTTLSLLKLNYMTPWARNSITSNLKDYYCHHRDRMDEDLSFVPDLLIPSFLFELATQNQVFPSESALQKISADIQASFYIKMAEEHSKKEQPDQVQTYLGKVVDSCSKHDILSAEQASAIEGNIFAPLIGQACNNPHLLDTLYGFEKNLGPHLPLSNQLRLHFMIDSYLYEQNKRKEAFDRILSLPQTAASMPLITKHLGDFRTEGWKDVKQAVELAKIWLPPFKLFVDTNIKCNEEETKRLWKSLGFFLCQMLRPENSTERGRITGIYEKVLSGLKDWGFITKALRSLIEVCMKKAIVYPKLGADPEVTETYAPICYKILCRFFEDTQFSNEKKIEFINSLMEEVVYPFSDIPVACIVGSSLTQISKVKGIQQFSFLKMINTYVKKQNIDAHTVIEEFEKNPTSLNPEARFVVQVQKLIEIKKKEFHAQMGNAAEEMKDLVEILEKIEKIPKRTF